MYIRILSTGGLKNPSMRLCGNVTKAFFLLDASGNVIRRSALDSKSAGIVILQKCFESPTILCHNQRDEVIFHLINIIYNCFFSAQTKTQTKLQLSKIKYRSSRETIPEVFLTRNLSIWSSSLDIYKPVVSVVLMFFINKIIFFIK